MGAMESSSCTRPHFQGRVWPPRPPPAARDPPSHSSSSAIVVVPAKPPPGHPAATAPPRAVVRLDVIKLFSINSRTVLSISPPRGPPSPLLRRYVRTAAAIVVVVVAFALARHSSPTGSKALVDEERQERGPARHSLGRRQPSGRGPLVLPPHHLIRRPRCTLRALVDEKRQERGPVRHGPGRRQPDESSSSPFAGRAHVSTARLASNAAIRYLHHQMCPGVLLHPPGRQLLCLGGGCGRAPKLAVLVCRTHACRHRPTVFVRQTYARLHRPVNVHRPQNPPGLG